MLQIWWMLATTLSAKKQTGSSFWQIVNEGCPQKGVVFDEIDTNCGIVNRVSIYVHECVFEGGGGEGFG